MDVALDTYADARAPVPPLASGVVAADHPNHRLRFHVELVPGETTLVSWKKLVQEANNEVVDAGEKQDQDSAGVPVVNNDEEANNEDSAGVSINNEVVDADAHGPDEGAEGEEDEDDLENHIQEEKSRIKESASIGKRDQVRHKTGRKESSKSSNVQKKTMRKEITDSVTSAALQEKKCAQHDSQSRSLMRKNYEQEGFTNIKQRNNKGRNKMPDLNLPYPEHALVFIGTPTESSSSFSPSSTTSLLASWTSFFHETRVVSPGVSSM